MESQTETVKDGTGIIEVGGIQKARYRPSTWLTRVVRPSVSLYVLHAWRYEKFQVTGARDKALRSFQCLLPNAAALS